MRLKELRIAKNSTQQEIAQAVSVTQYTYSNYETGFTQPTIQTLCKLADYYHVTLDYLVGREFANDAGYLTDDEKRLLTGFRKLSEFNKGIIIGNVEEAAKIQ